MLLKSTHTNTHTHKRIARINMLIRRRRCHRPHNLPLLLFLGLRIRLGGNTRRIVRRIARYALGLGQIHHCKCLHIDFLVMKRATVLLFGSFAFGQQSRPTNTKRTFKVKEDHRAWVHLTAHIHSSVYWPLFSTRSYLNMLEDIIEIDFVLTGKSIETVQI